MDHNGHPVCKQFDKLEIAHFYDKYPWKIGETYRMRVSHIYDVSKFWIVLLEQELTLFQQFLHRFYTDNAQQYKILSEDLCRKIYCVAYTEGTFYRGIIVDIPQFADNIQKAVVFLIDYGHVFPVKFEHLYYLHKKLYQVPHFAVRACISQIQPNDGDIWTQKVIQRFNELVCSKVLLCLLEDTDPLNKIVYIAIGDVDQHLQVHDIADTLLNEKLAIPIRTKNPKYKKNNRYLGKKYPFLFPTFEAIESGEMPTTANIFNLMKQSRSCSSHLQPYYYFIDEKNAEKQAIS